MKSLSNFSFILISLFLLTLTPAWTQTLLELDLPKAVDMAIKESEGVQIKTNEMERRRYQRKEALSTVLPHLSASVKYNYYPAAQEIAVQIDPTQPPQNIALVQDFEFNTGVTWNQTIYTFGKVRNAINAAKHAKEAAQHDWEATTKEVAYNTALSYFAVLLAQETLAIAKQSHTNAIHNRKLLEKRFAFGRVPKADNIKIAADIAVRVPSLRGSESSVDLALRNLKTAVGIQEEILLTLTDAFSRDFPHYDVAKAVETMLTADPTLRLLAKTVEINNNLAGLHRAQHFPTLEGFASYNLYGQGKEAYIDAELQHLGTLGLVLNIPIWEGGRHNTVYQQAKLDAANAELQLKAARKQYNLELRKAISDYRAQIDTYKANLEAKRLSAKSFRALQDQYAAGKLPVTSLNDAELQLTNSKLRTLLNLHHINQLIAAIERHISPTGDITWIKKLQN